MKIVASGPISSWNIEGEIMETVKDFIFLGAKISVDNDCTHEIHEIKRCLVLERKADTPRQHIKKQRHNFLTNLSRQSYVFSSSRVCVWELDRKKVEHQRADVF